MNMRVIDSNEFVWGDNWRAFFVVHEGGDMAGRGYRVITRMSHKGFQIQITSAVIVSFTGKTYSISLRLTDPISQFDLDEIRTSLIDYIKLEDCCK